MKMEYITTSEFVCINCGEQLPEPPGQKGVKGKQLYCSKHCSGNYQRSTTPEQRKRNKEIIRNVRLYPERQCEYCGKSFRVHAREKHKYCSNTCWDKAQSEYHIRVNSEKAQKSSDYFYRSVMLGERICIYCGKDLPESNRIYLHLYCNQNCAAAYYSAIPLEQQQRNRKTINDLIKPETPCLCCGKIFEVSAHINKQKEKFCSQECRLKYSRRDEVETIRKLAIKIKNSDVRIRVDDFVVSLWLNGYSRKAISEAFGMQYSTLKVWLNKFQNPERKYAYNKQCSAHQEIDYAYRYAQTAEEWITALKDKTRGYPLKKIKTIDVETVYLMCEKINISKGVNNLGEIVREKLGLNLFDGGVFAFVGNRFKVIRCIFYDSIGLSMIEYHIKCGSYPWPPPKLGASIKIKSEDFELLLSGGNRYRNKLSWNNFDLSD